MMTGVMKPGRVMAAVDGEIKRFQQQATEEGFAQLAQTEIGQLKHAIFSEKFIVKGGTMTKAKSENAEDAILGGVMQGISNATAALFPGLAPGLKPLGPEESAKLLKQTNIDNVVGNVFEGALMRAGAVQPFDPDRPNANDAFDFPAGMGALVKNFAGLNQGNIPTDAKATYNQASIKSLGEKAENYEIEKSKKILKTMMTGKATLIDSIGKANQSRRRGMNRGGGVSGSDTVPAMLTPGEFVVSKKAAQSKMQKFWED